MESIKKASKAEIHRSPGGEVDKIVIDGVEIEVAEIRMVCNCGRSRTLYLHCPTCDNDE